VRRRVVEKREIRETGRPGGDRKGGERGDREEKA
jgi:hypothetical protein